MPARPKPKPPTAHTTSSNRSLANAKPNKSTKPVTRGSETKFPWPSPLALTIFGPQGVGKTEFAMQFGDCLCIHDEKEVGVKDLVDYGRLKKPKFAPIEVHSFNDLVAVPERAGKLRREGVETLVFDALTGMEALCFDYHTQQNFGGDTGVEGFMAYNKGPKQAARVDWDGRFLSACQNAVNEGLNVILIAHAQVKTHQNPEGPDYDRWTPFLDKDTWQFTHKWAKAVLFYNYHFMMAEKKGKEDRVLRKGKARQDSVSRLLYTEWTPAYDAKNRMGLPSYIEAGESGAEAYQNFCKVFKR